MIRLITALWSGVLAAAWAHAAEPSLPPVDAFVAESEFFQPQLSPDGTTLAVIGSKDSTRYLAFIDLRTMEVTVDTSLSALLISNFWWKGNDLLLVDSSAWSRGGYRTLNLKTKKLVALNTFNNITAGIVDPLPADPNHVIVSTALNTGVDLRRFNVRTQEFKVIEENPGFVRRWIVDHVGRAVAALGLRDEAWFLLTREKPDAPWRRTELGNLILPDFNPIGVHPDQRRMVGWDNRTTDTSRFVARDPMTGADEVLAHRPDRDCGSAIFWGSDRTRVRAVEFLEDRTRLQAFTTEDQQLLASLDAALPETSNIIVSASADETRLVIRSQSGAHPTRYSLLDRRAGRLIPLGAESDALLRHAFSAPRHFSFTARDGVAMTAQLLLPPGVTEARGLPVVVVSTASIEARTDTRFNPFMQLLATRGYAVMQVNHRGVWGFGRKFNELGNETIHSAMADDLVDALDHAVRASWVDAARTCVLGEGGGGLLSVYALSRHPGKFKVWVNFDTPMTRAPLSESTLSFGLRPTEGTPSSFADRQRLRRYALELEPLPVASALTLPSYHVYNAASLGRFDGAKLKKALERTGAPARFFQPRKTQDWSNIINELRQQRRQETVRCWTDLLDFLGQHLGVRQEPPPAKAH